MVPAPELRDSVCADLGAHCPLPLAKHPPPLGRHGASCFQSTPPSGTGCVGVLDLQSAPNLHSSFLRAHTYLSLLVMLIHNVNATSSLLFIHLLFLPSPPFSHFSPSLVLCLGSDHPGDSCVQTPPVGPNGHDEFNIP